MTRFLALCGLTVFGALLGAVPPASASCVIPTAMYAASAYGADAVTATVCTLDSEQGGGETTSASTSYSNPPASLSASADLASGTLTADADDADGGYASAAEWDTFTFMGLPDDGAVITTTLSLDGTVTGLGSGSAELQEAGPGATIEGTGSIGTSTFFNAATDIPLVPSISLTFLAMNDLQYTVYADILADSGGSTVDLDDPPTLSLIIPEGVTASSASRVFTNFQFQTIPEPSSFVLFAALALLAYPVRRFL
jgi:hypothetical protein